MLEVGSFATPTKVKKLRTNKLEYSPSSQLNIGQSYNLKLPFSIYGLVIFRPVT